MAQGVKRTVEILNSERIVLLMYRYTRHQNRQEVDLQRISTYRDSTYKEWVLYGPFLVCSC